jgi:methionyl-tRNA formyltransferase
MRIALLCEESAGARVLEALARAGHEITALLTSPPGEARRGAPVWALAQKLGCRPVPARRVREPGFAGELARAGVEVLVNVHSLHIVPEPVLRVPALGAYNLHPGPLPECAGLNAPSWAVYHGEARHGVTVHRMERGIDTGAIACAQTFALEAEDTALSVALRCAKIGVALIEGLIEALARNPAAVRLTPQDLTRRRYFGSEVPQGGRIRWTETARRIHAFVRACDYHPFRSPWGTPRSRLSGEDIEILKVALTGERCDAPPGSVRLDRAQRALVAAADEWVCVRRAALRGKAGPGAQLLE